MTTDWVTEESFLKDVADHEISVISDDGVNRHIRFRKPGTICMGFDLITWPGHLCYTGDMGTYVFSRVQDMFDFFRSDKVYSNTRGDVSLAINPRYWSEKLLAVDRYDGFQEWGREKFVSLLRGQFTEWAREQGWSEEDQLDFEEQFEDLAWVCANSSKNEAYSAVIDFSVGEKRPFADWRDVNTDVLTDRYLWCCYALVWGIKKYDETKGVTYEPSN